MKLKAKAFLATLVFLAGLANSGHAALKRGGDGVGNGGHFLELDFIAMAYDLYDALKALQSRAPLAEVLDLDKLKAALEDATVKARGPGLMLNGEPRHAVNYPDLVLVEFEAAEFKAAPYERRVQMVLHEFLPVVGILDPGYHKAIRLTNQLRSYKLLGPRVATNSVQAELLYSRFDDQTREGFAEAQVREICNQVKERNESTYFVVYCEFVEKAWGKWVEIERWHSGYRSEVHEGLRLQPPMRWSDALTRASESYTRTPEWRGSSAYGLKVYGLGRIDQLPWRVLISSLNFGVDLGSRRFSSRREARDACRELVYRLDSGSLKYYRATCRTGLELSLATYFYEVITQNPLAEGLRLEEKQ